MEYFEDLEVAIEFLWNIDRLPKVTVYNEGAELRLLSWKLGLKSCHYSDQFK